MIPGRHPVSNVRVTAAIAVTLVLLLVHALVGQNAAQAPALTLLSRDGRRPLQVSLINEQEFVALDDLASMLQLAVYEETPGAITVSYKGRTIVLPSDQPLASVAGKLIALPAPPARSGRRWLVPIEFITRALAPIYDARIELRRPSRLLVLGDLRVPRLAFHFESLGSAARLTIEAVPRAASTVSQQNERLTIKFDADALDVSLPPGPPQGPGDIVRGLRLADPVTIAIDLGSGFAAFRASSEPLANGSRLVIDFVPSQAAAAAAPAAPAPAVSTPPPPAQLPNILESGASRPSIRTIVIDPGHGGDDEGAKGAGGTKEKDLTLAVGRRLKATFEARLGVRVLLTREDDRQVMLDDRAALANNNKADLFISLHVNASMRSGTTGASIGLASFDRNARDAAGASYVAERVPTFGGGSREIERVLWDLAQFRHVEQSAEFAVVLVQQLHDRVPLAPHAIERAPFRVLESANMPAVILEMGYLSNPEQEKQLADPGFQTALVQAVFDSVLRFRDYLDHGGRGTSDATRPAEKPIAPGGRP